MIFTDGDALNNSLSHVAIKACGMRRRDADVLVEVEQLNGRPRNVRHGDELLEKFKLGCAGGGDDADAFSLVNGGANGCRGVVGGGFSQRVRVGEYLYLHWRQEWCHSKTSVAENQVFFQDGCRERRISELGGQLSAHLSG